MKLRFVSWSLLTLAACQASTTLPEPEDAALLPSEVEALLATEPVGPPLPVLSEQVLKLSRKQPTLSQALRSAGLAPVVAQQWIGALATALDLRKLRASDPIKLYHDESGALRKLVVERSPFERVSVGPSGDALAAALHTDPTDVAPELCALTVESSLYQAMVDAGHNPDLAFELADMFAWDLDFYQDVQKGDRVVAWVEARRRLLPDGQRGELIGYGKLMGAIYAGQVGHFSGFHDPVTNNYYDETGRALRKAFLKSPLKYARVTSRYGNRKHPVLGYTRKHQGIDFSASIGTPVWAIGDGVVTGAGWQGGYGKAVIVRHPNGFESIYAHLSQVLVRTGQRVAQKLVVGHSGNTGLSSGPHLHFGLKRGGGYVNPFSISMPRVEPLPEAEVPRFRERIQDIVSRLKAAIDRAS